jgi:hypothetical protein
MILILPFLFVVTLLGCHFGILPFQSVARVLLLILLSPFWFLFFECEPNQPMHIWPYCFLDKQAVFTLGR